MEPRLIAFAGVPGAGKDTAAGFLQEYRPNVKILKFATPLQDVAAILDGTYDAEGFSHRPLFDNHIWKNSKIIDVLPIKEDEVVREAIFTKLIRVICSENPEGTVPLEKCHFTYGRGTSETELLTGERLYDIIDDVFDSIFTDRLYSPRDIAKLFGTELGRNYIDTNIWVSIMEDKLANTSDTITAVISDLRFLNEMIMTLRWNGNLVYINNAVALAKAEAAGLLTHGSEKDQEVLKRKAHYQITNPMQDKSLFREEVVRVYETIVRELG